MPFPPAKAPPALADKNEFPPLPTTSIPLTTHKPDHNPPASSQSAGAWTESLVCTDELKRELHEAMRFVTTTLQKIAISSTVEVDRYKALTAELMAKLYQADQQTKYFQDIARHLMSEAKTLDHNKTKEAMRAADEARSKINGLQARLDDLEGELKKRMGEIALNEKRAVRAQEREIELESQLKETKAMLPSPAAAEEEINFCPTLNVARAMTSVCSIGCFEAGFGSVEMRGKLGDLEQCLMQMTALSCQGRSYQGELVAILNRCLFEPGLLRPSPAESIVPQNETWSDAIDLSVLVLRSARCRSMVRGESEADVEKLQKEVEALIDLLSSELELDDPRGPKILARLVFLAADLWVFCSAAHPLLFIHVSGAGRRVEDKKHSVQSIQGHEGKMREGAEMVVEGCFCPGIAFVQSSRQEGVIMVAKEKIIASYVDDKQKEEREEPNQVLINEDKVEIAKQSEDQAQGKEMSAGASESSHFAHVQIPSVSALFFAEQAVEEEESGIVHHQEAESMDWEEVQRSDVGSEDQAIIAF